MKLLSAEELVCSFIGVAVEDYLLNLTPSEFAKIKSDKLNVTFTNSNSEIKTMTMCTDAFDQSEYKQIPQHFPLHRVLNYGYLFLNSIMVSVMGNSVNVDVNYDILAESISHPDYQPVIMEILNISISTTDHTLTHNNDTETFRMTNLPTIRSIYNHDNISRVRLVNAYLK